MSEGAHVAILGWAGATERQLRGVVRFHDDADRRPFTTHARIFRNMAFEDGWAREGAALAARLRVRMRRDEAPILVHLFSNAGFWTLAAALDALPERCLTGSTVSSSIPRPGSPSTSTRASTPTTPRAR